MHFVRVSIWKKIARSLAVVVLGVAAFAGATRLPLISNISVVRSFVQISPALAVIDPGTAAENAESAAENPASDDPTADTWYQTLIKEIMYGAIAFFGYITLSLFNIMAWVAQYNGFTTEPIVVKGWTLVRDVCNMFFIFAMLLIAFGTILRIQAYHYRSMLFKVVLAAVLMNLSKSIAGILIDLSQVVMLSFVSAFQHLAAGSLTQALGIDKLLNLAPTDTTGSGLLASNAQANFDAGIEAKGAIASAGTLVASYILAAVLMFLIFVTILAIVATLLVRILKLWILVILSPLAFAGTLFKGVGSAAGRWWDELTKELVAGPTLMFFLWLVLAIAAPAGGQIISGSEDTFNPTNLSAGSTKNLVNLLVVVGLLWAGIGVAKAGGGAAAAAVGFGMNKIGKGSLRIAGKGTAATARFGGRWAREAGSRMGVNTAIVAGTEAFKATKLGKAATFFSAAKTKQRWEKRQLARQQREVTQLAGIETVAKNLGMEKTVSWVQSAKQRRGARYKAEANKKVAERMKQLDEQGITDDATIRGAAEANLDKNDRVIDEIQATALMYKLQKQGSVNSSEAGDLIIRYTNGMQNEAGTRLALKGLYKDSDTSRIHSDGTALSGAELEKAVSKKLSTNTRDSDKAKPFEGIDDQVAKVDADGNMTDQVALAKLNSEAFDADYFDKIGKQRQQEVERAYMLAIANSKDTDTKKKLAKKFNDVTRRSAVSQQQALDNASSEKEEKKLRARFNGLKEVSIGSDGLVTGDAAMAQAQTKLVLKQRNNADKEARATLGKNSKLTESEQSFRELAGAMDNARVSLDAMRVSFAELAELDPETDRSAWGDALGRLQDAQDDLVKKADAARAKVGKSYVDENGVDVSPEQMVYRHIGGNRASEADELSQMLLSGKIDLSQFQQRMASMNTGTSAHFNRVMPNVRPVGALGAIGWNKQDQAYAAAFVPGIGKRNMTPPQRVARVVERGGIGLDGVSSLRSQADTAYRKVVETERAAALEPVVKQLGSLIERLQSVQHLDPVQGAKLKKIADAYDVVLKTPKASLKKEDISAVLGDIEKLNDLA